MKFWAAWRSLRQREPSATALPPQRAEPAPALPAGNSPSTAPLPVMPPLPALPPESPPQGGGRLLPTPPERLFTSAALERAWLAVKQAGGGPGVDGVTIATFEQKRSQELAALRTALVGGLYRPQPVRQVMVPKRSGGLRPLALWALRDRVAQRVIYDLLAPIFEPGFLPCSYGFRIGRSTADAIAELQRCRDRNLRWVVDADIKECFDAIPSARLLELVRRRVLDRLVQRYVAGWLQARLFNSADGVPKSAGTSQGSVLSPLLANIYLHEVDRLVVARNLAYLRYADDFVVCCQRRGEAETALSICQAALGAWGLELNPTKTRIVHFDEGFAWLGYFLVHNECYRVKA